MLATVSAPDPSRARTIFPSPVAAAVTAPAVAHAAATHVIAEPAAHPLRAVSARELERLLREEPQRLGSASVGEPTRGALFNGAQLTSSDYLEVVSPANAWGTASTVAAIDRAALEVRRRFGKGPPLHVGDVSCKRGGHLKPHRSHQSGLDADLGYFYSDGSLWYAPATVANLDRARTWHLMKALIDHGDVDYIFVDRSIQTLLAEHARQLGEDPQLLDALLSSHDRPAAVIRHTWGHTSHFHVRFADGVARETGRRLHDLLRRTGKMWTP